MVKLQPADNHEQMQQCSFSHYASDNIKFDYQPYKTVDDTKPKWDSTNEVSLFCKRGFCCFITAMKRILYQHHTFNDKCFKIRITVYLAYNISNTTMLKRSFMNNSMIQSSIWWNNYLTYLMKKLSQTKKDIQGHIFIFQMHPVQNLLTTYIWLTRDHVSFYFVHHYLKRLMQQH